METNVAMVSNAKVLCWTYDPYCTRKAGVKPLLHAFSLSLSATSTTSTLGSSDYAQRSTVYLEACKHPHKALPQFQWRSSIHPGNASLVVLFDIKVPV